MTGVQSQPTSEIDSEILGSIAALDNGSDNDDGDDGATERPRIPVSKAKEAGGLNAEAVQSNRRRKGVIEKKLAGELFVPWGEQDACLLYDDIITVYPPHSILLHVTRISGGSKKSEYLRAQPRNGMELYEALRTQIHKHSAEAEYQVVFRSAAGREDRGRGTILLPSAEFDDDLPQRGASPQAAPAPVPQQPPPGYPPPYPPPQGYLQPPQMQYPPQHEPPPQRWGRVYDPPPPQAPPPQQPQAPVASADPVVVMQLQKQLSEISSQLQGLGRAQSSPMAQQLADIQSQLDRMSHRPNAPPPVQVVHAPPPPQPVYAPPPQPPPAPPPVPMKMPEVPPGYALTTINGMPCFVPLRELQGLGAPPPAAAPVAAAPPPPPPPPPVPQLSPVEQFQATIGVVKGAVDAVRTLQNILPTATAPAAAAVAEAPEAATDDSPTKNVKIGDVHTVQNVSDGSIRPVDTFIANLPSILGWAERQRNEILARNDALARQQQAAAAAASGQPLPQQPATSQIGVPVIPGR